MRKSMLETLSELHKLIDTFVIGVIEFVYRYLHAVMKVAVRPISGPWELRSDEARLSSRTVLFCSSAALSATFVVGIDHFNVLGEEASVGIVICPLLSGPSTIIVWTTKEKWNGAEAQARGGHRQAA